MTLSLQARTRSAIAAFKQKARNKQITATDILVYNLIRGKALRNGFSPISRKTVLENGKRPCNSCIQAISHLQGCHLRGYFKVFYSHPLISQCFTLFEASQLFNILNYNANYYRELRRWNGEDELATEVKIAKKLQYWKEMEENGRAVE